MVGCMVNHIPTILWGQKSLAYHLLSDMIFLYRVAGKVDDYVLGG